MENVWTTRQTKSYKYKYTERTVLFSKNVDIPSNLLPFEWGIIKLQKTYKVKLRKDGVPLT